MAYDETQKDFPLLGSQVRIQDLVKEGGGSSFWGRKLLA